jgi:hypothetical protein
MARRDPLLPNAGIVARREYRDRVRSPLFLASTLVLMGVALMVTISTTRADSHLSGALKSQNLSAPTPDLLRHTAMMGYHDAFLVGALLILIPLGLSFLINDKQVERELETHALNRQAATELAALEA